jgi:hypothetical protein
MRRACMILAVAALPGMAQAGAWPREKGQVFVSVEQAFDWRPAFDGSTERSGYASAYAEYGLTPRLTLGAKAGMAVDRSYHEALAFARLPLLGTDGANRFAADAGAGARWLADGTVEPVLRSGLAWGRGYSSRWGDGWIGVEGTWTRAVVSGESHVNLDATVGLNAPSGAHYILQLRGYDDAKGTVYTVAPSYVRRVTDRLKAQVGATWRPGTDGGEATRGLFTAVWVEF